MKKLAVLTVVGMTLAGCSQYTPAQHNKIVEGAVIGGVAGAVIGGIAGGGGGLVIGAGIGAAAGAAIASNY